MIKTPPSRRAIAVIVAFVIACVLLLIYLWIDFGGSTPLAAQGYRVKVAFTQANELATGADVRIAGVNVGKVVSLSPDLTDSRTLATLQINPQFVPIPRDTRATLRIKTLLGETYVQLSWGNRAGGALPDGARLPNGQVAPDVALDQILATFDPRTRRAFQTWMQAQAGAVTGRGTDINNTFALLPAFVTSGNRLTAALDHQSAAVRGLVAHTGQFFSALSARRGQLSGLITGANRLFSTTATRNRQLAALFAALPDFERQTRLALPALTRFGDRADPVVRALTPLASPLTRTFQETGRLAPDLRALFARLGPVTDASRRGLPALDQILTRIAPLTGAFEPFLRNANPIVRYISLFKPEITGFFANVAAASQGFDSVAPHAPGQAIHFIRASQTLAPSGLTFGGATFGSSRNDAYRTPGAYHQLAHGLPVLDPSQCTGPNPAPPAATLPASVAALVKQYVYRSRGSSVAAPPCRATQLIPGFATRFPQLRADPPPAATAPRSRPTQTMR